MTDAIEFRPSHIQPQTLFVSSPFQNSEKEAVSAFIATFLAAHGDDWNKEFTWQEFGYWLVSDDAPVNEHYKIMIHLRDGEDILNAIHALIEDGYIKHRDEDSMTYFCLAEQYIEFFRQYA